MVEYIIWNITKSPRNNSKYSALKAEKTNSRLLPMNEYYIITEDEFKLFSPDEGLPALKAFADECREHKHNDRLLTQPGADRDS